MEAAGKLPSTMAMSSPCPIERSTISRSGDRRGSMFLSMADYPGLYWRLASGSSVE
jgi:hypothetical protein